MKKYAVQYAYDRGIYNSMLSMSDVEIVVDTNPITYKEALDIFNANLEDFKYRLEENQRPNLVIWEDVGDGKFPNYHTTLVDLNWVDNLEIRNGKFYKVSKIEDEIELPITQKMSYETNR